MNVAQILKSKPSGLTIVDARATIQETARRLAEARKGLALVCDAEGALEGVVSVIDINRAVAEHGSRAAELPVEAIMTREFCACGAADAVDEALARMTERGVRHLPVIVEGKLVGLLNIRSLLEAKFEDAELEADEMRRYIWGAGYH